MYTKQPDLTNKTIIVMGGTCGFGAECVKRFFALGARVIFTGTNLKAAASLKNKILKRSRKNNKLKKENIVFYQCDYNQLIQIKQFTDSVKSKETRIDILLNNVGTHLTKKDTTFDGNDALVQINYFGSFYLTDLLLPLLLKTENSRIVNTSCESHDDQNFKFTPSIEDINIETRTYHWYKNYCESKLWGVMFVLALKDFILKKHGPEQAGRIKIVSCDPGRSRTGLIRKAPRLIQKIFAFLRFYVWFLIKDANAGAQHLFSVCLGDWESIESGKYYSQYRVTDVNPDVNPEMIKSLWNVTIETLEHSIEKFECFEKFSE